MGSSAYDRLISQKTDRNLNNRFGDEAYRDEMMREAQDLAASDKMPLEQALKIVSGQTRPAYGTARPIGFANKEDQDSPLPPAIS